MMSLVAGRGSGWPRFLVPVFGPLAGSSAAERCRAAPSGVLGSDVGRWFLTTAPEMCLVVSRVRRGTPIAELPSRSCVQQHFATVFRICVQQQHRAVLLDGTATCNPYACVFNETPEAGVETALVQASPGRRYRP
ncbi:hypothetical protein HPB50_006052 [Hyalomma asiaticum]|uniref:Uncharacterized protein n=1 Tax=Hyalomma asiaticum TaxID=266040 RepID=A0ACB7SET4_HYAAI|nr:hypothetical protein HPB50_006052 [Hyalomma asiaticum]